MAGLETTDFIQARNVYKCEMTREPRETIFYNWFYETVFGLLRL